MTPNGSTGRCITVKPCRSRPGRQRAVRGQRQDGRSGAGDDGRNACRAERVDQSRRLRIGRPPVLLVQPVRGGGQQQARTLCESENGERGTASGERGIRERNHVGKQPARRGGGRFDLRDERDGRNAGVRIDPYSVESVVVIPRDDESSEQARRRVVRVPLHAGRDLQQRIALGGDVAARERRGSRRARDDGGGGTAEAARVRDRVAAAQVQPARVRRRTPRTRDAGHGRRDAARRGARRPRPRRPRPSGRPGRRRRPPRRRAPGRGPASRTPARGSPTTPGPGPGPRRAYPRSTPRGGR